MAKSIADTLEGSNPQSKYHIKKQKMYKDGYEADDQHHKSSSSTTADFVENFDTSNPEEYRQKYQQYYDQFANSNEDSLIEKYVFDETLPDVIKRSIAQATMNDPVRLVHAPESFKEAHFTEHVTHTQMPPKAAMSLAQALESENAKGGRGAQIFQNRKARSEKWVIDESNVKKNPYGYQPSPTQQVKFHFCFLLFFK